MNNVEYWTERSLMQEKRSRQQGDRLLSNLKKEYVEAQKNLQEQMNAWYEEYADEKGISIAQAKKKLTVKEYRDHCETVEQFIEKAKTGDPKYDDILRRRYIASRVSRLQALQDQVSIQLELLGKSQDMKTFKLLQEVYKDTFTYTAQTVSRGIRGRFDRLDTKAIERIYQTPWSDKSFSERIWGNNKKLVSEVRHILAQGAVQGSSIEKMSRQLTQRMKVDYNRAECLIRTETAYIREQATADSYTELGIEQYEYLATLDNRTSAVCRSLDKKVFTMKERMIGVNYPPMHPRCRSTTIPYFPEDSILTRGETRAARDENDKTVQVDARMDYETWYKETVLEISKPVREAGLKVFIGKAMYDKMSTEEWQRLAEDIRRMPPEHVAYINNNLDKIEHISDSPWLEKVGANSHYDPLNKRVYLRNDLVDGEFAHELGHFLEKDLKLQENERFQDFLKPYSGYNSRKLKVTDDFGEQMLQLPDDGTFISAYQRILSSQVEPFNEDGKINLAALTEYFAEGYKAFISDEKLLKNKNPALYQFIEELIK